TCMALTGAMISNLLLLWWIKSTLLRNVGFLQKLKKWVWFVTVRSKLRILVKSKYSSHIIPILAGFIFATPLPNQWGIALLALSGYRVRVIVLPILLFSFIEIFFVVSLGRILS
ncbi:MAG: hypothetical protein QMD14_04190, partial [Candidatus Aenigmarchaeota archaeon]|nr:hypothetical protein [Candidatus Aenigmarchaeota archaeon]